MDVQMGGAHSEPPLIWMFPSEGGLGSQDTYSVTLRREGQAPRTLVVERYGGTMVKLRVSSKLL